MGLGCGKFFLGYITEANTYPKLNGEMHNLCIIIKQAASLKLESVFMKKTQAENTEYFYRRSYILNPTHQFTAKLLQKLIFSTKLPKSKNQRQLICATFSPKPGLEKQCTGTMAPSIRKLGQLCYQTPIINVPNISNM